MRYANDRQISRVTIAGLVVAAILVAVFLVVVLRGGLERLFDFI